MSRREYRNRRLAALVGVSLLALGALAGCGKQGGLDRPAPLFGSRARAEYEAQRAQDARDEAQRAAQRGETQPATTTTPRPREARDPNQRLEPASVAPVPGAPNPFGGPTSAVPAR
jgi:predicted small lipoprotein YifL